MDKEYETKRITELQEKEAFNLLNEIFADLGRIRSKIIDFQSKLDEKGYKEWTDSLTKKDIDNL